jgi:hypothetical protein
MSEPVIDPDDIVVEVKGGDVRPPGRSLPVR